MKKETLFDKIVNSGKDVDYEIQQFALPGYYTVREEYLDIDAEENFEVREHEGIEVEIMGQSALVKNTGNTVIHKKIAIDMQDGSETYVLYRKVKLDPGEDTIVDLSREVPKGEYRIVVGEVMKDDSSQDGSAQVLAVKENVAVDDNRGKAKKAADALSDITGRSVKIGDIFTISVGSLSLFLIIVGIITTILLHKSMKESIMELKSIKKSSQPQSNGSDDDPVVLRKMHGKDRLDKGYKDGNDNACDGRDGSVKYDHGGGATDKDDGISKTPEKNTINHLVDNIRKVDGEGSGMESAKTGTGAKNNKKSR